MNLPDFGEASIMDDEKGIVSQKVETGPKLEQDFQDLQLFNLIAYKQQQCCILVHPRLQCRPP